MVQKMADKTRKTEQRLTTMAGVSSPRKRSCVFGQKIAATTSKVLFSRQYSDKILKGLNSLRQQGLLCDFVLESAQKKYPVHKAVMASCSDYFHAMLMGDMVESKSSNVTLQGLTPVGLHIVVEFAYTGSIDLNLENLEEVLSAASHLQMAEAVELCCNFMELALTVENCVDILNMCELYSLKNTLSIARNFILENFENLSETDQYMKLNNNQLASIIMESSLKVISEYNLFELVLKWITYDPKMRNQYTAQLMENIRLPLLSGEELVEKVSKVPLMHDIKACSLLLTQAKDYHIVVSKQPLLQSSQTQVRSDRQSIVICHAENLESYDIDSERHAFLKDAQMPMYNPCVCVVDNFLYCCGGKYDSNENNEIATARCFRYDPRFDSWYEMSSMNEARKDFAMVAFDNKMYAVAGQDENMVMCTTECFSIANNDWETCLALNHAVYGHAATVVGEKIYISGGQKFDGYCNTVLSYIPSKDYWAEEPHLLSARSNHNMAEVGGFLYILGGNIEDAYGFPVPVTSIERFDPVSRNWSMCSATLNIREAGCCIYRHSIYIVGGINGQHYYSDIIQKFDPKNHGTVVFVDKFPTRIYGKACCILTLPQYL